MLYQLHATSPGRDEHKLKLSLNKSINQSAGNSVPLQMGIGLIHIRLFTHSSLPGRGMTSLLYANEIFCHIDCSYLKNHFIQSNNCGSPSRQKFGPSEIISVSQLHISFLLDTKKIDYPIECFNLYPHTLRQPHDPSYCYPQGVSQRKYYGERCCIAPWLLH